jgi:choline dehydrogenase-like flavoprotein
MISSKFDIPENVPEWITPVADLDSDVVKTDYLVVGSGAGGSMAAHILSSAGKDVTVVEEGQYHPDGWFGNRFSEGMRNLYRSNGVVPMIGAPMIPFAEAKCVGGGTVINGALLWRTPSWILNEWRDKNSLTGFEVDDMAPHFESIERALNVNRHSLDDSGNNDSKLLVSASQNLGWNTVMAPRAVSQCINENTCPLGCGQCGKQSTTQNYLPQAGSLGTRVIPGVRVSKLSKSSGKGYLVVGSVSQNGSKKLLKMQAQHVVVAGGPINTPFLLKRSGLKENVGNSLNFHMNLKVVAVFKDAVDAENGTIFTAQVQEFEREGLLMMASTLQPHLLVTTAGHFGNETINHLLENYARTSIYVAMIKPRSTGKVIAIPGSAPIVRYRFDQEDSPMIQNALIRISTLLFEAGAAEVYLPIRGSKSIRSLDGVRSELNSFNHKKVEIVSVHGMSSVPMGGNREHSAVRPDGSLWADDNILVTDASILPSSTGESPQGTIMAMTREALSRQTNITV